MDSYDRRSPAEHAVLDVGLVSAGYLVVESLYEDDGTTPHSPPGTGPTASDRPVCSPCRSSTDPRARLRDVDRAVARDAVPPVG